MITAKASVASQSYAKHRLSYPTAETVVREVLQ